MRPLFLFVAVTGCAALPEPAPAPEPAPEGPPPAVVAPHKENIAIAGLMDTARADAAAGNLTAAAASLERALRIEPRNPRLWHELARVRLRQGEREQAANLAQRSNSWAGSDAALRAANDQLITEARRARGAAPR
jgi:Tfp pilus assembly protein PilF